MKKFFLSLLATFLLVNISFADEDISIDRNSDKYTIDQQELNLAFENAELVNLASLNLCLNNGSMAQTMSNGSSVSPWAAWALCTFLGELGIHRVYLHGGADKILWYCVSCGGIFGVVPLVDWVVLLVGAIQKDYDKYVGNTDFIMWM